MQEARDTVLSAITTAGKAAGLKGFEQAKAVVLSPMEWTVENDLLTPSFKVCSSFMVLSCHKTFSSFSNRKA